MSSDKSMPGSQRHGGKSQAQVNPGDAAPPGTPGTGENVCPDCKGSGRLANAPCKTCGGTGKVIEGISGG
jgi:DnaJ-class molecular chaperone